MFFVLAAGFFCAFSFGTSKDFISEWTLIAPLEEGLGAISLAACWITGLFFFESSLSAVQTIKMTTTIVKINFFIAKSPLLPLADCFVYRSRGKLSKEELIYS
jgi:hypothetical protein